MTERRYVFGQDQTARSAFGQRTIEDDLGFFAGFLKPGMSLVDCGCGGGRITLELAKILAPGHVVGFDASQSAITQARAAAMMRGWLKRRLRPGCVDLWRSGSVPQSH